MDDEFFPRVTDIDTATRARSHRFRSGGISVEVSFTFNGCQYLYRHVARFASYTKGDTAKARRLVNRINARGGLTLRHVATSPHWVRTGKLSGCVQVNKVTVSDFEPTSSGGVSYKLRGPVASHWGAQPVEGAVWDFGRQYDYTGRTEAEIKSAIEDTWEPGIFGCRSYERWPYRDENLSAALAV